MQIDQARQERAKVRLRGFDAARSGPGWADLPEPLRQLIDRSIRLQERIRLLDEAIYDAAPAAGLAQIEDLNDLDGDVGMAISPINVYQGIRWNASFAYLDPVRDRPNLTMRGNVLADRLVLERGRVSGVEVIGPGGRARVDAGEVVVSSGAYGSPALLLRSGIGDPAHLRAVGVEPLNSTSVGGR